MLPASVDSSPPTPPCRLFGCDARWRAGARPTLAGSAALGPYAVRAWRWAFSDVTIETMEDLSGDGHVLCYAVEREGVARYLSQQRSVFYQEVGSPDLTPGRKAPRQPPGAARPRWFKSDLAWPVERGVVFDFVAQGRIGANALYLFHHPTADRIALHEIDLEGQDAEDHYAEEAGRPR